MNALAPASPWPPVRPDAPLGADVLARFVEKVDTSGECWMWTAGSNGHGYGCIQIAGRAWLSHRVSFLLFRGDIPAGLIVRHRICGRPGCVRPDHLAIGNAADNAADMFDHGTALAGALVHTAVLDDGRVMAMRRLHASGVPVSVLAPCFGIGVSGADSVVRGETWKHLPMAASPLSPDLGDLQDDEPLPEPPRRRRFEDDGPQPVLDGEPVYLSRGPAGGRWVTLADLDRERAATAR